MFANQYKTETFNPHNLNCPARQHLRFPFPPSELRRVGPILQPSIRDAAGRGIALFITQRR